MADRVVNPTARASDSTTSLWKAGLASLPFVVAFALTGVEIYQHFGPLAEESPDHALTLIALGLGSVPLCLAVTDLMLSSRQWDANWAYLQELSGRLEKEYLHFFNVNLSVTAASFGTRVLKLVTALALGILFAAGFALTLGAVVADVKDLAPLEAPPAPSSSPSSGSGVSDSSAVPNLPPQAPPSATGPVPGVLPPESATKAEALPVSPTTTLHGGFDFALIPPPATIAGATGGGTTGKSLSASRMRFALRGLGFALLGSYILFIWLAITRLQLVAVSATFLLTSLSRGALAAGLGFALGAIGINQLVSSNADAFLYLAAGLYPNWLMNALKKRASLAFEADDLTTEVLPLCLVDGIQDGIVDRLGDFGILDAQHLAKCNPIELSLRTNFPIMRILDWVDQAMLIGYVRRQISAFRIVGIRSASDLATLYADSLESPTDPDAAKAARKSRADTVMSLLAKESKWGPDQLLAVARFSLDESTVKFIKQIRVFDPELATIRRNSPELEQDRSRDHKEAPAPVVHPAPPSQFAPPPPAPAPIPPVAHAVAPTPQGGGPVVVQPRAIPPLAIGDLVPRGDGAPPAAVPAPTQTEKDKP